MIKGHHHLSLYTKDLKKNDFFYTEILGFRRVKVTVNQNNPKMLHVFYGDRFGSPGNDLTFFDYSQSGPRIQGTNAYEAQYLLVPSSESLNYWEKRLYNYKVTTERLYKYKKEILSFKDPNGFRLGIITTPTQSLPSSWEPWTENSVAFEHRILGTGSVVVNVRDIQASADGMIDIFNYLKVDSGDDYVVVRPYKDAIYGEIIYQEKQGHYEKPGWGTAHHLAIELRERSLDDMMADLKSRGYRVVHYDRYYFDSLYFRGPNQIMYEIVGSKSPGFTVDIQADNLGKQIDFPPKFQTQQPELESILPPLESWTNH